MLVSLNRGTPTQAPKYYNPYRRDPQKGTPNFGKLQYFIGTRISSRRQGVCLGSYKEFDSTPQRLVTCKPLPQLPTERRQY